MALSVVHAPKTFNLFGFDLGSSWWRLFQKRIVRTKLDINVFIFDSRIP